VSPSISHTNRLTFLKRSRLLSHAADCEVRPPCTLSIVLRPSLVTVNQAPWGKLVVRRSRVPQLPNERPLRHAMSVTCKVARGWLTSQLLNHLTDDVISSGCKPSWEYGRGIDMRAERDCVDKH
jgi:hypothetical protein